jgi:hypothetical protein
MLRSPILFFVPFCVLRALVAKIHVSGVRLQKPFALSVEVIGR